MRRVAYIGDSLTVRSDSGLPIGRTERRGAVYIGRSYATGVESGPFLGRQFAANWVKSQLRHIGDKIIAAPVSVA